MPVPSRLAYGVPQSGELFGGGLSLKAVEVVTSMRQRYVDGTASHSVWKLLAALKCRS